MDERGASRDAMLVQVAIENSETGARAVTNEAIYDTTADIPFEGNAYEYLLSFCRCRLAMKIRQRDAAHSQTLQRLYRKDVDKWQTCVDWLESARPA